VSITFENANAAKVFYDAYISQNYMRESYKGLQVQVGVTLQSPYWHSNYQYLTDNVLFNRAVSAADRNHDGVITESEASRFFEQVRSSSPVKAADSRYVLVAK